MDKHTLRRELVGARNSLDQSDVREWSTAIARRAQAIINWQNIGSIHCYKSHSVWNEPDTAWVEAFVYAMWPSINVTIGEISQKAMMPEAMFDLIIVPLVGFDESANRLGLGGGWYDRFIARQPQAITIGLAYEMQKCEKLVMESHDQPLDYIVTERRVITR